MKPVITTCVLALALLVFGTNSARAVTMTEYDVTVEGQATYARSDAYPAPYGQWEQRDKAAFKWKTHFSSVTFIGKQVGVTSALPESSVSDVDAETFVSIPTPEGPKTGACTGTTVAAPPGPGWFGAEVIPTPDPTIERLNVRVLGGISFHLPSCTGTVGTAPSSFGIGSGDPEVLSGPFDQAFDMPHEAIGMGKIIQLLDANVSGARCPGHGDHTASCVLNWKATVTFVRTAQRELGPGGGDQSPDGGSDPDGCLIPMPQPDPACPDPDEELIPMLPKAATLSAGAQQAKLKLTCRAACSGSATAYPARRGARSSALRPLARTRFTGKAGRPITIVLRFRPKARRAIRRAGAVRIELRVAPAAGGRTVQRNVVLRLPRAPR
jgi:hypothetical protein